MQATPLSCEAQAGHIFREIRQVRQIAYEPKRRWFACNDMDLIVWYGDEGALLGFELCYDKGRIEKSMAWRLDSGFRRMIVDDGEGGPGLSYKATPMLVRGDLHVPADLVEQFRERAFYLPNEIRSLVLARMTDHQGRTDTQ